MTVTGPGGRRGPVRKRHPIRPSGILRWAAAPPWQARPATPSRTLGNDGGDLLAGPRAQRFCREGRADLGELQTVLRRQRSRTCRVESVVFRSTFKRGSGKGEDRQPVWQVPQHPQADAPAPPRAEEAEAKRDMQQQREAYMTGSELNASLGRGSEFEGKLAFEGKVRIDGNFTGEISTNDTLHIGEGAKVSAEINCATVIVQGEVVGT